MATFNGGVVAGSGDGGWIVSPSIFSATAVNSAVGNTALVGNVPVHMFLHIPNVTIAPGSTINSALLTVVPDVTESGGAVNTILRAEASANPSPPTSQADATGRTRTTASVAYNNIPAYTDGVPVVLPDIAVVLQEIVNLPGWASGNSILLFWEDNGSSPGVVRTIAAVEHPTLAAPSITIDYTPPVTTTPVGTQRSASWNALSTLGTERSASWSIQSPVPIERQALWSARAVVGAQLTVMWALRATVGEDHLATWSVFSAVAREADASWDVRALVNASRAASWNVLSSVGADRAAPWSVRALVSVDGDVAWRVFGAVGTQRNVLWAARAPVGATTSALWDVDVVLLPGVVGSSRSAQWDVRQLVFVDRSAQWSALTIAPVERAVVWGVRTAIGAERDVQWSTFQLVGVERSIEWALLGFPVGVSASALWGVRFPVGAERIVLWNVVGLSAGIHYETPLLVRGSRGRTTAVGQRQARATGPRGRTRVEVP